MVCFVKSSSGSKSSEEDSLEIESLRNDWEELIEGRIEFGTFPFARDDVEPPVDKTDGYRDMVVLQVKWSIM